MITAMVLTAISYGIMLYMVRRANIEAENTTHLLCQTLEVINAQKAEIERLKARA